jgi:hypothetical protein
MGGSPFQLNMGKKQATHYIMALPLARSSSKIMRIDENM